MNNGALVDGVVRIDYLGSRETKKGVDGNEDDADRIIVNGASPLKMMICTEGKGWSDVSFPKGREGSVIGLVD